MADNSITAGLGKPGKALVSAILADLQGAGCEPDAREAELIRTAGELRDRMASLEVLITTDGLRNISASGIVKLHPAAAELRQHSIAISRVLAGITLVDNSGNPVRSVRHQRAASARWARVANG